MSSGRLLAVQSLLQVWGCQGRKGHQVMVPPVLFALEP